MAELLAVTLSRRTLAAKSLCMATQILQAGKHALRNEGSASLQNDTLLTSGLPDWALHDNAQSGRAMQRRSGGRAISRRRNFLPAMSGRAMMKNFCKLLKIRHNREGMCRGNHQKMYRLNEYCGGDKKSKEQPV